MVEVIACDEFAEWYLGLDDDSAEAVTRYVDLLSMQGTRLGYPYSSAIAGTAMALRELRVRHAGYAYRVFYAFDPARRAVILMGGDKRGDRRFYRRAIARCESIWRQYLEEVGP